MGRLELVVLPRADGGENKRVPHHDDVEYHSLLRKPRGN